MKRTLYWVTKDLRINDNAALTLASKSERLLCVYIVDKQWFEASNFQAKPLGDIRWRFLQDCLSDFNQSLLALGQQLHIVYGDTLTLLSKLCEQHQINHVITTHLPGTYENKTLSKLKSQYPEIEINRVEQFTLFTQAGLPFELENLPKSYTQFKKQVLGLHHPKPIEKINALPPMFKNMPLPMVFRPKWLPSNSYKQINSGYYFDGGEHQGLKHLNQYFSSDSPFIYQQARNNLDGWRNSSKLSPWLAYGCISARQVADQIYTFEKTNGKNDSVHWLYLELLWREYFQWLHFKIKSKIYQFKGLANIQPLTSFYPERLNKWCMGNTPYPLVNACMNELRLTGYLSNRGRQIVASCLVNELSVDWRYGAAWFEECLIDYDAAVNWGNWQYIAGVGVDTKGGRHFNLDKQATLYDPYNVYQEKWANKANQAADISSQLDSVDASDWPITQSKDVSIT